MFDVRMLASFRRSKVRMFVNIQMFESSNVRMFAYVQMFECSYVQISKSSMVECSLIWKCSKVQLFICSLMFEVSNGRKFSSDYFWKFICSKVRMFAKIQKLICTSEKSYEPGSVLKAIIWILFRLWLHRSLEEVKTSLFMYIWKLSITIYLSRLDS